MSHCGSEKSPETAAFRHNNPFLRAQSKIKKAQHQMQGKMPAFEILQSLESIRLDTVRTNGVPFDLGMVKLPQAMRKREKYE
ncbi:hypothetical protein RC86_16660 [Pectobacterium brasiliense]|nr:hypothetical protein RC86_16660 [Pectobacterium brasiliense]